MAAYPPELHVLRDLRFESQRLSRTHARGWAPLQPGVLASDGSMRVSAMAMMIDVAGASLAIMAAAPDWSATADLSYWTARPIVVGPVICDAHLVRAGSGIIVIDADVFDGHGTDEPSGALCGHARMTFARIPGSASQATNRIDRTAEVTARTSMFGAGSGFPTDMLARIGLRFVNHAAGIVECDKNDYIRNSFGTINGGVIGVIAEAAAERAACAASSSALVARDLQVHYLAQTKVGPARTQCRVIRAEADHAVVSVRIVDAGNHDTVLSLATVTFSR